MVIKQGRYGQFLACVSPTCKNKKTLDTEEQRQMDINEYLGALKHEEISARLLELLIYLRSTHHYCAYCGAIYDDEEQLEKMCPGIYEADH